MKKIAIILAAGKGSRMKQNTPKQYICVEGTPIILHTLKTFQESIVDEIILVVGEGEVAYCEQELQIPQKYSKVTQIIVGGKERYDSVYNALSMIKDKQCYVMIHDGARPLVSQEIISKSFAEVATNNSVVVGVPVKDTIKEVEADMYIGKTIPREQLWQIQTPQTFFYILLKEAYEKMMEQKDNTITDDAMVMEKYGVTKTKIIEGDYKNIKITTPEDLIIFQAYLQMQHNDSIL